MRTHTLALTIRASVDGQQFAGEQFVTISLPELLPDQELQREVLRLQAEVVDAKRETFRAETAAPRPRRRIRIRLQSPFRST